MLDSPIWTVLFSFVAGVLATLLAGKIVHDRYGDEIDDQR
jgi:hypothetical protein